MLGIKLDNTHLQELRCLVIGVHVDMQNNAPEHELVATDVQDSSYVLNSEMRACGGSTVEDST